MYLFKYTMSCKDSNGIDRDFEHAAFFGFLNRRISLDLLNFWLLRWTGCECPNGGIYRYHVTPEQEFANATTPCIHKGERIKAFVSCWTGRQSHDHFLTADRA